MKTLWVLALLALLLSVGHDRVVGKPGEADQLVALAPAGAAGGSGEFPATLSEYVFMHQTRGESTPIHPMAGWKYCP